MSVRAYARPLVAVICLALLDSGCRTSGVRSVSAESTTCDTDTVGYWVRQRVHSATRAVGLLPLADSSRADTGREIRLWYGTSYPVARLLRVWSIGGAVTGELVLYWPVWEDGRVHEIGRVDLAGRCDRVSERRPGFATCTAALDGLVDWRSLLQRLEVADVWTLPDQSAVPRELRVWDGHGIAVEVRRGRCYRAYAYDNPEGERRQEYQRAATIILVVVELEAAWRERGR